jgi:hypothetical protein
MFRAQEDRRAEAAGDSWNCSSFQSCLAGEAMRITGEVVWNPALTQPGAQ